MEWVRRWDISHRRGRHAGVMGDHRRGKSDPSRSRTPPGADRLGLTTAIACSRRVVATKPLNAGSGRRRAAETTVATRRGSRSDLSVRQCAIPTPAWRSRTSAALATSCRAWIRKSRSLRASVGALVASVMISQPPDTLIHSASPRSVRRRPMLFVDYADTLGAHGPYRKAYVINSSPSSPSLVLVRRWCCAGSTTPVSWGGSDGVVHPRFDCAHGAEPVEERKAALITTAPGTRISRGSGGRLQTSPPRARVLRDNANDSQRRLRHPDKSRGNLRSS